MMVSIVLLLERDSLWLVNIWAGIEVCREANCCNIFCNCCKNQWFYPNCCRFQQLIVAKLRSGFLQLLQLAAQKLELLHVAAYLNTRHNFLFLFSSLSLLSPVSSVKVIESVASVCLCVCLGFWDLHCAPTREYRLRFVIFCCVILNKYICIN